MGMMRAMEEEKEEVQEEVSMIERVVVDGRGGRKMRMRR